MIDMHEFSSARTSENPSYNGGIVLKAVVDAMLDSLTVEQQAKMASYLLRATRSQNGMTGRVGLESTACAERAC